MTVGRWRRSGRLGMAALLACGALLGANAPVGATTPTGAATDGPGAVSHYALARKDCLGTARNTTSKVWFTVANGALSDVFYPTNDNTNVQTLQYVVTDGSTFTDLQSRDTTYTVRALSNRALDCRVTSTAKSGKYRLTTDYITDPFHNTVVMHTRFEPLVGARSAYKLYVLYDPNLNGNGGGGSGNGGGDSGAIYTSTGHDIPVASDPVTTTNAANRTYATPVYSALDASSGFTQESNGFVGAGSDPFAQLDHTHTLTSTNATATDGNLVQAAQVDLARGGDFSLALGFGASQSDAVAAAEHTLSRPFVVLRFLYELGWRIYDQGLNTPPRTLPGVSGAVARALGDEYYLNANLLKASEDKTFPGALQAGPTTPWGQAVSAGDPANTYNGAYREVFARDLYEQWTGLYADGDYQTAADATNYLFYRQQLPDGSMPRNSLTNGKPAPDSFNTQLDECSYPILMAYQLGSLNSRLRAQFITNSDLYQNHIKPAANFVISHGPSFGPERWEEQSGYSPSTIAAEVAGLVAAADIADANGDTTSAALYRGVADDYQRSVEGETVTTNGPYDNGQPAPNNHTYFIRLSKTGDPNAAISYNVGNGGPTLDQRAVIDQGFLELVRLGLIPANDPNVTRSLPIVDSMIMSNTVSGPGWHRYNGDGYGDRASDGKPWPGNSHPNSNTSDANTGTGHVWPVLTGERAEYDLAAGDATTAVQLLNTMRNFAGGVGLIPEQDWDLPDLAPSPVGTNPAFQSSPVYGTDPMTASIGFQNGKPAGSSDPLAWAEGQYVRLVRDIATNSVLERPANVYDRYVAHQQGTTTLTIGGPADNSAATSASVIVTGTTAPGNTIYVAGSNTDNNTATTMTSAAANGDGSFSVTVPVTGGTTVINVVAVSPSGGTAHAERSVYYDYTPGTVLYDVTDPTGDDNGPGNYAYPTASDFHPGAYDIQEFKVIDSGDTVTFKLKTRDLTPTFGSPLGAQLVDVYVHDPKATMTSTASSYPAQNYSIAPSAAWSRLVEVQGFGQKYVDASGAKLGAIQVSANSISRYITFSVSKASLGQPASGWGFTVALTGQGANAASPVRDFTATPQGYTFGVCATASADPHCTVDPNTVPKAMDVLTPAGVSQSDELDYTKHQPVVLQDVTIP